MSILIDASWTLEEAVYRVSEVYRPGSMVSGQARIVAIESWASLVGREVALSQLDDFIKQSGSKSAAARNLMMSLSTLKRLHAFFETLPEMKPKKNERKKLVFLSHSSKDKPFARRLMGELKDAGIAVWIDEVDLRIGQSLVEEIGGAIARADFVAVVLSKNSVESRWVKQELQLAMARQVAGNEVVVLPVLIEDCELPSYLRDRLYADFRDATEFDVSLGRLLKTIKGV